MTSIDRNDLSYWFTKLQALSLPPPMPRTEIVTTKVELAQLLDGVKPDGYDAFLAELSSAAERIGYPIFLRTGHTSGKHSWKHTCFVEDPTKLSAHVWALVEASELADIIGLSYRTWAVREFLALKVGFHAFGGMPVAVERRWFFRDGDPLCSHDYWPEAAIIRPDDNSWRLHLARMRAMQESEDTLSWQRTWVEQIAYVFDGAWSVDFAMREDGSWVVIDMAEMDRSWHPSGCPNHPDPADRGIGANPSKNRKSMPDLDFNINQ